MIELTDMLHGGEDSATAHEPVLLNEVVEGLAVRPDGVYVDGTAGGGGHAEAVARRLGPGGRLVVIDRDREALDRARDRLAGVSVPCSFIHANFSNLRAITLELRLERVDGVLLDLGVSSDQLDTMGRGFSFRGDAPLDMRMDQSQEWNAADIIRECSTKDLAELFRTLGEEPAAMRIADAIDAARQRERIETTGRLAELVVSVKGSRPGRIHPATQVFQALRMTVNEELESLERGLSAALEVLVPGGRLAVISFHSLEDRIVKLFLRRHEGREESLPQGGVRWIGEDPPVERVTRKPIRPTDAEVHRNPRARSAKLRIAERVS